MRAAWRSLFQAASAAVPAYTTPVLEVLEERRLLSAAPHTHAPVLHAGQSFGGKATFSGPKHTHPTKALALTVEDVTADGHLSGILALGSTAAIPFSATLVGKNLTLTYTGADSGVITAKVSGKTLAGAVVDVPPTTTAASS